MVIDVFKTEFKRLCDGFSYQPRPGQVQAFYERLQHCHEQDWHEAVTDLLCAPQFPRNLDIILAAVDIRAEQRRRHLADTQNYQAHQTIRNLSQHLSMAEAFEEAPALRARIEKILGRTLA